MKYKTPTMSLKRERMKAAQKLLKLPPGKLEPVNLESSAFIPPGMTRAFRNNRYTVMIFDNSPTTKGPAIRAMIQRLDNTPIPFHWRELQKIKNEIFGVESMGVEYYPKESQLQDTHNIYWLWVFPEGILPEPIL
jgi:hypothetical protein